MKNQQIEQQQNKIQQNENQQSGQQQSQRAQQLEEVARHYTNAASALRNQNEEECTSCIKKAEAAAQEIQQPQS